MESTLEPPDELITLQRAAELSGVSVGTLRIQARAGKLAAKQLAYTWFTTRRWLHAYLLEASQRDKGSRLPLPESYVPPEDPIPPTA